MNLDELFYALGDVAAKKRTLEDVCKDMAKQDKDKIAKLFEAGKLFLRNLKTNVKEEIRKADIEANYDTSGALTVDINGKKGYVGLKPKNKQSWWKKWRENAAASLKNSTEVIEGSQTVVQGIKSEGKRINKSMMNESSAYRKVYGTVVGSFKGMSRTVRDLRGISGSDVKPQTPKNPYENLNSEQLSIAMGVAYENLIRMEHSGEFSDDEKAKGLAEVQKVIDAVKERFPDIKPEGKGAYFQNVNVQSVEAELFAYMKADAAKNNNAVIQGDVARYEAWRKCENFEVKSPMMTITEIPYENVARFGSASWRNDKENSEWTVESMLKNPLKSAKKAMTSEDVAATRKMLEKLNVR